MSLLAAGSCSKRANASIARATKPLLFFVQENQLWIVLAWSLVRAPTAKIQVACLTAAGKFSFAATLMAAANLSAGGDVCLLNARNSADDDIH